MYEVYIFVQSFISADSSDLCDSNPFGFVSIGLIFTEKNRFQTGFHRFFDISGLVKTGPMVPTKPVPVRLHSRFFPVAATGLRNTIN